MNLKGSKTEQNLMTAFAGESQARNKYTYFASVAKKEGYEQIASIFLETAENEKEHAKLWFKALGELGNTKENLLAAAQGENYEWTEMYLEFAKKALRPLQNNLKVLPQSKKLMKKDIVNYLKILKPLKFLLRQVLQYGYAVTVVIFI